jgi:hypothetical protein
MKPIAWMSPDGKLSTTEGKLFYIPLYTAPRELSDDEIMEVLEKIEYNPAEVSLSYDYEMRIARAILKKASEK